MEEVKQHTPKEAIQLGATEAFEERCCPECGGVLVTNFGPGIEITHCVDCGYDECDYN